MASLMVGLSAGTFTSQTTQSKSMDASQPMGQHPSPGVQAVIAVLVQRASHWAAEPLSASRVQALPSSGQESGQLSSHCSPASTAPLPQTEAPPPWPPVPIVPPEPPKPPVLELPPVVLEAPVPEALEASVGAGSEQAPSNVPRPSERRPTLQKRVIFVEFIIQSVDRLWNQGQGLNDWARAIPKEFRHLRARPARSGVLGWESPALHTGPRLRARFPGLR